MSVLSGDLNQDSIAIERTRRITLGFLVLLATLLILWWSFDSFQLWRDQGAELSMKQAELSQIQNEYADLEIREEKLYLPSEIEWLARQNFGLIKP